MNERSMRSWLTELADENEALRADVETLKNVVGGLQDEIGAITELIGYVEADVENTIENVRNVKGRVEALWEDRRE